MSDFQRITLVSVSGLPDARRAADALTLSLRNMPGARALLCSPARPSNLPSNIDHRRIGALNYHEYSWFMMFALWRMIETDFALIVQDDGWVLDTANWTDEFFEYDYVGPTVHVGRVDTPDGTRWFENHLWNHELGKPGHVVMPVLNGGFCLRSRRMMRALIDHPGIKVHLPIPDAVDHDPLRLRWSNSGPNEDTQLTALLRPELEAAGLRYAPVELCLRFGMENAGYLNRGTDMMKLFGHHSTWRRLVSIDPPTVQYRICRDDARAKFREYDFVKMLEARGYRVQFAGE
jgi:hypothetical protein